MIVHIVTVIKVSSVNDNDLHFYNSAIMCSDLSPLIIISDDFAKIGHDQAF